MPRVGVQKASSMVRWGAAHDGQALAYQVLLDKKRYEWEDKYKPRKPRFFNRVTECTRVLSDDGIS